MLNPHAPLPLYRQLADVLAAEIRAGKLAVGERIPSEHELAARHALGRPTVRQATELLVRNGLLQRRRGSGTFVTEPPAHVDLFALDGTLAAFQGAGLELQTRVVDPPRLARGAGGREVIELARLGSIDGTPVLHERFRLDAAVFPGLEHVDLAGRSLSRVVAEHYLVRPSGGTQTLAVSRPDRDLARLLKVGPRTSLLVIDRQLDFPGAPAAFLATMTCRTDKVRWAQTLREAHSGS